MNHNAIAIVLLTWFLGNMGIHLVTPSLPNLNVQLIASGHLSQMVISLFLLGKSLGVLLWGPFSECYGRRRFMLFGLVLYIAASMLSAHSSTIGMLLLSRFFQGLGVSATLLMGRTIINDLYPEKKAIKAFALLFTLAGIVISVLPLLGGLIATYFTWQLAFYIMAGYALCVFCLTLLYLPETNCAKANKISLSQIVNDYKTVLKHPLFLAYLFISALMVAGESAFNTSAAFILIKTHGFAPHYYGMIKTSLAIAHLLGSAYCAYAIKFSDSNNLVGIGVISFLIGSVLMVCFNMGNHTISISLVLPMLIYYFGTGFIVATTASSIVRPFPKKMATAMAFCLFLQFILSAAFSFISSIFNIQTAMPLSIIIFSVSLIGFSIWFCVLRPSKASQKALAK
jgi:MFS transporter, DHA1 family, 2-module integral membrane pump EmrD